MATQSVYSARDEMQAQFLVQVLDSHEIEAQVKGAALHTLAGYLPVKSGGAIEVHVDEADVDRARPIVERFDRSRSGATRAADRGQAWTCPNCGEVVEPQFTDCWKCQTPRPGRDADEPEASRAAAPSPPPSPPQRLPPDPQIAVDLACVRCDYNLRGLPVDRPCPECAYPAMASLLETMQAQQEWTLDNEPHLWPCLDYIEISMGFPIEAIRFVMKIWPQAATLASGSVSEGSSVFDELSDALRHLATDFFGDPLSAARAMQRWNLSSGREVQALTRRMAEHGLIEL